MIERAGEALLVVFASVVTAGYLLVAGWRWLAVPISRVNKHAFALTQSVRIGHCSHTCDPGDSRSGGT